MKSARLPARRIKLTYADYRALPDDGKRYEILDGELYVTPAPVPIHQQVSRNLFRILDRHVEELAIGQVLYAPIDLILATTTVAQPDLVFIGKGRETIITHRAIEAPPELVVEILSPSSRRQDRTIKWTLYARFGVSHYWILDPKKRTFELHELDGTSYRLADKYADSAEVQPSFFPGLTIDLGKVWV